jgi:hypothetical protein
MASDDLAEIFSLVAFHSLVPMLASPFLTLIPPLPKLQILGKFFPHWALHPITSFVHLMLLHPP